MTQLSTCAKGNQSEYPSVHNDIMNYGCAAPLSVVEGGKGGAVPTDCLISERGGLAYMYIQYIHYL